MSWKNHIIVNEEVLAGKPIIKGTRLSVEFILGLFSQGWEKKDILENYPNLTKEDINAVFDFSAECMKEEAFFIIPKSVA